ncbi:MAG: HD domain-containing protein [Clostridia bacterium]|nr:HD domain-containing protein [Clostridia bacterium]
MNIDKAKNEFMKYVSNYDLEIPNISRKVGHSIRVMEISKNIAKDLNLSKEQMEIATIIGLLHDIARFEQWKRYGTFSDINSIDHGDLGVEILKQDDFIREFIDEDKYDSLIYVAIKNHNKYKIEDGLTEEELLFSKIIRDADKLDIIYQGTTMFWTDKEEIENIEKSNVTSEVYTQFIELKQVNSKFSKLPADRIVGFIAFIFDINFIYDFKVLKEKDYINKILDKFDFRDEDTIEKMKQVRIVANSYINQRNKG